MYVIFNDQSFNDRLTNDIVSFEQLGPERQKLYVRTCAPSEDSDLHRHAHNLIRIFTGSIFWIAKNAKFIYADNEDSGQISLHLSLLWAHMSEGTFSHVATVICNNYS